MPGATIDVGQREVNVARTVVGQSGGLHVSVRWRGKHEDQPYHLGRGHALLRLLPMRLQNRMPLDLVVVEEAVRRDCLAPTCESD